MPGMKYNEKMFNRQIGRNAQLYAQAVSEIETPEARYPYLRILISVIEQARPEWIQVPQKEQLFTHLINEMTESSIDASEIARVIQVRDAERQFVQDAVAGKIKPRPQAQGAQKPVEQKEDEQPAAEEKAAAAEEAASGDEAKPASEEASA